MLTAGQVARLAGISVATLGRWRTEGHGPTVYHLGPKTHRFRRSDVIAWIENRRTEPLIP